MRSIVSLVILVASSSALAASPAKQSVCHQDGNGNFNLINISVNAVDAHLANHGDVLPGAYHPDADGDGFGAMDGLVLPCPAAGYTLDASDCDDTDITISPVAEDVCGDEIDNDCDLNADEDCGPVCPCAEADERWGAVLENGVPVGYCLDAPQQSGTGYYEDTIGYGQIAAFDYGPGATMCFLILPDQTNLLEITSEEAASCINDISAWLDANGAVCE